MSSSPAVTFSLAYTSVRPEFIPQVVKLWNERSKFHDIEWVVCVDEGDSASLAAAQSCTLAALEANAKCRSVKVVVNTGPRNCSSGWNTACAATTGKVIIALSDDFVPPLDWDEKLLALSPSGWENGEYAVQVEDGYVHTLLVLPIITRKRYERFGYLYYPKYQSLFGDTEMTDVANRDNVMIDAHHLLFEHLHPDCGKRQRDQRDLVHASQERWNAGEMLYKFRKARGFPLDDGPKKTATSEETAAAPKGLTFAVYMQVIKDDLCLWEVCERLMQEGCRDFFFAVPDEYWSGEPVPESESATLQPVFDRLISSGATVRIKNFHVSSYRVHDDSRITVETRVRNDSLAWIRREGFQHILIVDGDELWVPGTLEALRPYVEQGHLAISLRMTPVMGNPGYPIDGATDVAVVYIGPKCDFRACRTPNVRQTVLEAPRIIHFTSTRRTMDENIKKHRRSGHYDDADYDFEGWLKDKLPHAQPGMTAAHMYTKFQIWPRIRNWYPEELAQIPVSIHPYLGLPAAG